jgi:hypothetical protein
MRPRMICDLLQGLGRLTFGLLCETAIVEALVRVHVIYLRRKIECLLEFMMLIQAE